MTRTCTLTKTMVSVAKTLSNVAAGKFYRADLKRAALAKATTLKGAAKRKAPRKKWN
jgi:hypothetical protein